MRLRVKTRLGLAISISNRENSVRVRLMRRCPRMTSRVTGSRPQVREGQGHRLGPVVDRGAPEQRSHTGQEFFQREGFRQVVVGTCIETGDALGHRVAGGEHQDRQVVAAAAKLTAHLEAIEPRHHHVEYERSRADRR